MTENRKNIINIHLLKTLFTIKFHELEWRDAVDDLTGIRSE